MAAEVVAEWHNAQSLVATLGIAGMLMDDSHLEANRDIDHALRSVRQLAEDLSQVGEGGPRIAMEGIYLEDVSGNHVQFPIRLISDTKVG